MIQFEHINLPLRHFRFSDELQKIHFSSAFFIVMQSLSASICSISPALILRWLRISMSLIHIWRCRRKAKSRRTCRVWTCRREKSWRKGWRKIRRASRNPCCRKSRRNRNRRIIVIIISALQCRALFLSKISINYGLAECRSGIEI